MKKIILSFALIFTIMLVPIINVNALEGHNITYIDEVYDDGSYIEISIISSVSNARTISTHKKTASFKDSNGKVLWSVTVTGTFNYNGKTSTCTNSSVTTSNNSLTWKLSNAKASKSGNTANASVTAKQYHSDGKTVIRTINKTVKLTCDKNGKLS